jgi:putative glutathione S-transferase
MTDPNYTGRFTVPILFDKKTKMIVNNESSEIIRMFNTEFNEFAGNPSLDLYPVSLQNRIDELNDIIYNGINNGVYKAGFATSQTAYEENAKLVHKTLLEVEGILKENEFICGKGMTETDIRLFTSILRYDPVYYGHFKCNLTSVRELPHLSRWLKQIYDFPGIRETVNMEHIKKHYYMSHKQINPTGIVPLYNGTLVE